jgi:hypothetical protein
MAGRVAISRSKVEIYPFSVSVPGFSRTRWWILAGLGSEDQGSSPLCANQGAGTADKEIAMESLSGLEELVRSVPVTPGFVEFHSRLRFTTVG